VWAECIPRVCILRTPTRRRGLRRRGWRLCLRERFRFGLRREGERGGGVRGGFHRGLGREVDRYIRPSWEMNDEAECEARR
jgi:hypothetical protein